MNPPRFDIKENDDCVKVGIDQGTSWRSIVDWNLGLDSLCSNTWGAKPSFGSTICVTPPGGEFTDEGAGADNPTPGNGDLGGPGGSGNGYADTVVGAPDGKVTKDTTEMCGEYIQAKEGVDCSSMLVSTAKAVPMDVFLEANPSLKTALACDSALEPGTWYCLRMKTKELTNVQNPSVGEDCEGITVGESYCVERNWGIPIEASSTTAADPTPTPTKPSNGIETPPSTQPGIVDNFNEFYFVEVGDTCATIVDKFGITESEFREWNTKVGDSCAGLWGNAYACVSIIGRKPSATKPITTTKPSPTNGIETPSPIQEKMVKTCNKFRLVKKTTTCLSIESYYNLPLATFYSWNPSVGDDCRALITGYWVCVGVPGWKPSTTTTTPPPTKTTMPANGVQTPSPIQGKMTKNCSKFHQIKSTTTCASIESYYNLPLATFLSWNPAVGEGCTSLLVGYWVCVGVPGWQPPAKPTSTKPSTPTNGIATPTPIQEGMTKSCNKFHPVSSTTTCSSIQNYYKITLAQLTAWNKALKSDCSGLWAGYNVCVGVIGQKPTPTNPGNGIQTPSPLQSGVTKNCKKFHLVASTTTCASIQKYCNITLKQFVAWNPRVGDGCIALWANYYVCVAA
ncbi:hypothetical protein FAUST_10152 [Fusarium austroamericanum]|uniref:LysM domain-containing protein n=1 Tax=Fusarium austroamericanum TaxID=282268 RepID=A0AAN5Z2U0_FUSAU|nr:hypothetical protein FAUST_10152 [Fusarium austroamericanum]